MTNKSFKCETPDSLPKCISEAIAMRKLLRPLPFRYVHLVLSYYGLYALNTPYAKIKINAAITAAPVQIIAASFSTENCKRKTIILANGNNISAYCMTANQIEPIVRRNGKNLNTCTRMYAYEINATIKA